MYKRDLKRHPVSVASLIGYLARSKIGWLSLSITGSVMLLTINVLKANYTASIVNYSINRDMQGIRETLIVFFLLMCLGTAASFIARMAAGRFSAQVVRSVKDILGDHLTHTKSDNVRGISSGDMVTRLNTDTERLADFMERDFQHFVIKPLMALVASIYIIRVNWSLFLVTFAFTPVGMLIAHRFNQQAREWYPRVAQSSGEVAGLTREVFTGIDLVKTYRLADLLEQKNGHLVSRMLGAELQVGKYNALLQPACYALAHFPRFAYILYGGTLVAGGRLPLGSFIALIQLMDYVLGPSVWLPFVFNSLMRTISSAKRIVAVLNLPLERAGGGSSADPLGPGPVVTFDHVGFSYGEDQIIHDMCFEIAPLTTVALVGPSGGGKSTVLDLIAGMVTAQHGIIRVCGADIAQADLSLLRRQMAVVPQEAMLFPGSIAENIGFGNPDAPRDEIVAAARAADADTFIRLLAHGYETPVTERGLSLSGGQRQRVAIARAFLRNAPLLLLDEPTSALDHQADAQVQKALHSLMMGRTVVVSAHRLATIERADQILVIDQGRIVERGTHRELLAAGGLYRRLVEQQDATPNLVWEEVSADA